MNLKNLKFDSRKHEAQIRPIYNQKLQELAEAYLFFPLKIVEWKGRRMALVAMASSKANQVIRDLEFILNAEVIPVMADRCDVKQLIRRFYSGSSFEELSFSEEASEIYRSVYEQLEFSSQVYKRSKTN